MTAPAVEVHEVQFQRRPGSPMHRAVCTCGWMWYGELEACQRHAAIHDLAWEPVTVEASAPSHA